MAESAIPTSPAISRGLGRLGSVRALWSRFSPDNLGTWLILVLMSVVIFVNGASLVFFVVFRDNAAVASAAGQAADQLIAVKRMLDRARPEDRPLLIRRLNSPAMGMVLTRRPLVVETDDQLPSRVVARRLAREFPTATDIRVDSKFETHGAGGEAFPTPEEIQRHMEGDDSRPPGVAPPNMPRFRPSPDDSGSGVRGSWRRWFGDERDLDSGLVDAVVRVSVKVTDTLWFNARIGLIAEGANDRSRSLLTQVIVTLFVAAIALWGLRRATRPLTLFVGAAERLGVDVNAEPLAESGPAEVRRAARAFNTMQTRIKRFIQDRTQMLAAISHDLRTPITRMKLRAEFVDDDEQRAKMLRDLDEMEAMIATTLSFARDDAANEPTRAVDVAEILAGIAGDLRSAGGTATYAGPDHLLVTARPLALKRALTNLADNAVKYGKCARIAMRSLGAEIEITVDDDGPGIPESEKERVFSPFYRIESSRSRETGGTGLGLTITRNAILSMGGIVELINRPGGGLRARVTLPVTAG